MYKFLVNYLENERNNIKNNEERIIRDKQRINNFINKKQYGGRYLDKIKQIAELYNNIDEKEIKERSKKTTELINDIINKINTELTDEKIAKINQSNYKNIDEFTNKLEIFKNSMEKFGDGFKINLERNTVLIPPEFDLYDNDNSSKIYFENVLNEIKKEVEAIDNLNYDEYQNKINEINERYRENIKELDDYITGIININEEIKKNNETFDSYIKIEANSIKFIDKLEDVLDSDLKEQLREKKITKKQAINKYNLSKSDETKYFDGRYTRRLTNNILVSKELKDNIKVIEELFNFDLLSIKDIENFENIKTDDKFKQIYDPDFTKKIGGGDENIFEQFQEKMEWYNGWKKTLNQEIKKYNLFYINFIIHSYFLTLVSTNQLFTSYYVIYKYMNRGILMFYQRILEGIIEKMKRSNLTPEILYLKKYHFITIFVLKNFIDSLINLIKDKDQIIDIDKCGEREKNCFTLLNYFKNILESYNEIFQSKITIWSRINNIGKTNIDKNVFVSDMELKINSEEKADPKIMKVFKERCTDLGVEEINNYKFTEVFDSTNFTENGDISKYMTLDAQLSKGKGVALMTYGYSGTGKTYTLFGKSSENKDGLLQSTLDGVIGLKKVNFRLFEVYGYGLSFSSYWKSEVNPRISLLDKIKHEVIKYNLNLGDNEIKVFNNEKISGANIKKFINDTTTYLEIDGLRATEIFKNFDNFIDSIDSIRMKDGRIRDTPNNIVSSRSILIYDFQLDIGLEKPVTFLIVDLPGREEIAQTYINPIFDTDLFKQALGQNLNKVKMLIATMALNPIALPIFYPDFYKEFNKEQANFKKEILTTPIQMKFQTDNGEISGDFTFQEERINPKSEHNTTGEYFEVLTNYSVSIKNNTIAGLGYKSINVNKTQYESLLGFHLINRYLKLNKFDELKKIYKIIIDKEINIKIKNYINTINKNELLDYLKDIKFKGEKSAKVELTGIEAQDREKIIELLNFDYILTPYEGIYINENIIGLIQYLSSKLVKTDSKSLNIEEQDTKLNFNYLQALSRVWLASESNKKGNLHERYKSFGINNNFLFKENLTFNEEALETEYEELIKIYRSDNIFNKEKPIITDILDKYISEINDYKVFYLFGNYANDEATQFKCKHQIKLLENTKDFIEIITKTS